MVAFSKPLPQGHYRRNGRIEVDISETEGRIQIVCDGCKRIFPGFDEVTWGGRKRCEYERAVKHLMDTHRAQCSVADMCFTVRED